MSMKVPPIKVIPSNTPKQPNSQVQHQAIEIQYTEIKIRQEKLDTLSAPKPRDKSDKGEGELETAASHKNNSRNADSSFLAEIYTPTGESASQSSTDSSTIKEKSSARTPMQAVSSRVQPENAQVQPDSSQGLSHSRKVSRDRLASREKRRKTSLSRGDSFGKMMSQKNLNHRIKKDIIEFAKQEQSLENIQFINDLNFINELIDEKINLFIKDEGKKLQEYSVNDNLEQLKEPSPKVLLKKRESAEKSSYFQNMFKKLYKNYFAPKAKFKLTIDLSAQRTLDELYNTINHQIVRRHDDLLITDLNAVNPPEPKAYFRLSHFEAARQEIGKLVKDNTEKRYHKSRRMERVQSEIKQEFEIVTLLLASLNRFLADYDHFKTAKQNNCCFSICRSSFDKKTLYEELEKLKAHLSQMLTKSIVPKVLLDTIVQAYISHRLLLGKNTLDITKELEKAKEALLKISPDLTAHHSELQAVTKITIV